MTAEIIAYMAFEQDMERRMEFSLVMQCAPFLKGMRAASILNVERHWIGDLLDDIHHETVIFFEN